MMQHPSRRNDSHLNSGNMCNSMYVMQRLAKRTWSAWSHVDSTTIARAVSTDTRRRSFSRCGLPFLHQV